MDTLKLYMEIVESVKEKDDPADNQKEEKDDKESKDELKVFGRKRQK